MKLWLINVVVVVGTMFQTRLFTAADTVVVGFLKFWTHANNKIIYKIVKWKERENDEQIFVSTHAINTHTHWKIYRKIHCCSIQNLAHVMLAAWMQKKKTICYLCCSGFSSCCLITDANPKVWLMKRNGWKTWYENSKNKELNFTFSKFIISKKLSILLSLFIQIIWT